MKKISKLTILYLFCLGNLCFAENNDISLDRQSKALSLIENSADRICAKPATGGATQKGEVAIGVKGELGKLIRRLTNIGINVSGDYSAEKHEGVLQNEVLSAAKEANSCKQHVFDKLVERLLPTHSSDQEDGRGGANKESGRASSLIGNQKTSGNKSPSVGVMTNSSIDIK